MQPPDFYLILVQGSVRLPVPSASPNTVDNFGPTKGLDLSNCFELTTDTNDFVTVTSLHTGAILWSRAPS